MKLLLTSSGLDNRSIAGALAKLTGKPAGDTKVAFVPTAANAEAGNKDWLINHYIKLWRYGYNQVDIVEPSAQGINWKQRLEEVDVVFIGAGNTFHLLDQIRKTGFDAWLNENRDNKVYIASSAGSIVFTPTIRIASIDYGDDNLPGLQDLTGLGWVDFEVAPHFEAQVSTSIEKYASSIRTPVYVLDDQSAIVVSEKTAEVVSEGFWKILNQSNKNPK